MARHKENNIEAFQLAKKLTEQGMTQRDICVELNKKGIASPTGAQWYQSLVRGLLRRNGIKHYSKKTKTKPSKKVERVGNPVLIMTDILTSNMADATKEDLIRAIARQIR